MSWRAGIVFLPLAALAFLLSVPLNHDVAWLLEATRRWMGGAELYRDIVEINPPLIFIENALLTGGLLSKSAYLAGVCISIAISSFWIAKWRGAMNGFLACLALILTGISDFGQRDHLALIFLMPFLLASDVSRREQIALGAWAFLGVGLKPYFAIIPALFVLCQCVFGNSLRPLWRLQNIILGGLCISLVIATALIWPQFFTDLIPLGRLAYPYFRGGDMPLVAPVAILIVGTAALLRRDPFGGAILGALIAYLAQGKFWNYQLIPSLGLAAIWALMLPRYWRLIGLPLLVVGPWNGIKPYPAPPIPVGVNSVLFLSDRVSAAYPRVFECRVVNASRYPTFWTLPAAWRSKNKALFDQSIANLNADIEHWRPEIVFDDTKPGRIGMGFHFADWADLSNYRPVGQYGRFRVWLRRDLPLAIMAGENCHG